MKFGTMAAALAAWSLLCGNAQAAVDYFTITFQNGDGYDYPGSVWGPKNLPNLNVIGDQDDNALNSIFVAAPWWTGEIVIFVSGSSPSNVKSFRLESSADVLLRWYVPENQTTTPDGQMTLAATGPGFTLITPHIEGITGLEMFSLSDFRIDDLTVSGGVPEPSSWALAIAGAGLIGSSLRRQRRRLATA